jgi:archaellum component FlaG (FlaF/FlaG flagellin family)
MADAASISVTATILPDEIQKVLDAVTITVTPQNSSEKWYYGLRNVTTTSTDLIAGNFLMTAAGVDTGSSEAAVHANDKVRFIFIKNTGTTDGSTSSTEAINICFDGGTAAYNLADGIEIGPGEVWFGKLPNTTVANLHAVSVDTNMGDSGSAGEADVQCIVAAILDDVA